jgi:hypothetical protein
MVYNHFAFAFAVLHMDTRYDLIWIIVLVGPVREKFVSVGFDPSNIPCIAARDYIWNQLIPALQSPIKLCSSPRDRFLLFRGLDVLHCLDSLWHSMK